MLYASNFLPSSTETETPDCTPAAARLTSALRQGASRRCVFEPGVYHFWPDRARERYLSVCNNDESLKRIAFDLTDLDDVEIDGQGAHLVFHGPIVPFIIERSRNVRIKNLTIDWAHPFHAEARVLRADDEGVDVQFAAWVNYRIEHDRLVMLDEERRPTRGIKNILEFDTLRRETAFRARDNYFIGRRMIVRELGDRRVRLAAKFSSPRPQEGNTLVIVDEGRYTPAIVLSQSESICLQEITIYHSGGMGVIGQRCTDVTLDQVVVTPSHERMISTTADATHFVNCRGHVRLIDCRFENQMDDPTNVHGVYARFEKRVDQRVGEFRLMHYQQWGMVVAEPGDRVEFVRSGSLATFGNAVVERVERVNKEITNITFDRPMPDLASGDAIANMTWTADVTIRGCTARANRARGFLVSTPGKIVIEQNHMHTAGAAVLIEGDLKSWYESGAVRDVTIRGNVFDDCLYGVWGHAVIQVSPKISPEMPHARYHRNIRVIDNTFVTSDPRLLNAAHVDGLTFSGNRIVESATYAADHAEARAFIIENCCNVTVEGNSSDTDPVRDHLQERPAIKV